MPLLRYTVGMTVPFADSTVSRWRQALVRTLLRVALLLAGAGAWGTVYGYYGSSDSGALYEYIGSETDTALIATDTEPSHWSPSNAYNVSAAPTIAAADTIIIASGASLTFSGGLCHNLGTIVNYGKLVFSNDGENTGKITNYGTFEAYGNAFENGGSLVNNASMFFQNGLNNHGSVTNEAGATITGPKIINSGTITNAGTITSITNGIKNERNATITNTATGTISVGSDGNGTIENHGTIDNQGGEVAGNILGGGFVSGVGKTYYWKGADSGSWTTSSNWKDKNGNTFTSGYPGSSNGDTAVFSGGESVSGLALGEAGYSLVIKNASTENRATISGVGENADSAIINAEGGYFLLSACTFGTLNVKGGKVQPTGLDGDGYSLKAMTVTVEANAEIYSSTNTVIYIIGDLNNSGTISGDFKTVTISGNAVNAGTLSFSVAAVTFGGEVTNSGTITGGSGVMTFNGDYSGGSDSLFKASSSDTVFYGDADFSAGGTFMHNGGTVHFFSLAETMLKTAARQEFNRLRFGGNVTINLGTGGASAEKLLMQVYTNSGKATVVPFLTANFTATLTGNDTITAGSVDISRCSGTDGVVGSLVIDCDLDVSGKLSLYSGTSVTINSGKTVTIGSFDDSSDGTNKNTFTVDGTLSASDVELGLSKNTTFSVSGEVTAAKITNEAGNANSIIVEENGKITLSDSLTDAATITNSGTITAPTEVSGSTIENNTGTIKTASLTAAKITSTGSEVFTGAGSLSVTDTASSNLCNVTIDSGAALTLANDIAVSGNWTNGGGTLSAGNTTVTFTGASKTIQGSQAFNNATFTANTTISGTNTFAAFVAETGGITLNVNAAQTVTDTLTLKGASETSRLSVGGNKGFVVSGGSGKFTGEYLSIGDTITIAQTATVVPGAFAVTNSSASAASTTYAALYSHGWKLSDVAFVWTGATSGDWGDSSNWDVELVPGVASANTNGVIVSIPDNVASANYPDVGSAAYSVGSLVIGTSGETSHNASLTLGTAGISVTGATAGAIIYSGAGRIRAGATPVAVNDAAHGGWVEYAGASEITDFAAADGADYANLRVSSPAALGGDIVVSGQFVNTAAVDGAHALSVGGTATVGGALGATTPLGAFTVAGTATLGANVTTSGMQKYNGAASVGAAGGTVRLKTSGDSVTFGEAVTVAGEVTIDGANADSSVTFDSTVDGDAVLSLSAGYLSFCKDVGFQTPLRSIECAQYGTSNSGAPEFVLSLYGASVKTTGGQTYNGYVSLCGVDGNDASSGGNSAFVSESGDITFNAPVFNDGKVGAASHALTVTASSGTVSFTSTVGVATDKRLSSLSVTADAISLHGDVMTSGAQTYNGAVTTGAALSLTTTADGAGAVTANGTLTTVSVLTVTTAGSAVSVTGAVSLGGALSATTAGGSVDFAGAITNDSAQPLTVDAGVGTVTFGGDVGTASAPLGVVTSAGSGAVTATGAVYAMSVTTAGDAAFSSTLVATEAIDTGGGATFGGTVQAESVAVAGAAEPVAGGQIRINHGRPDLRRHGDARRRHRRNRGRRKPF